MTLTVNEELRAYIDPLTPEEHDALERSILAEGCRDALVLWGDVLVDGHNRHGICQKHGIPFNTVQNTRFQSMADVHLWMIDQHLGRRSVSDFQRGVLALRKKEILAERMAAMPAEAASRQAESSPFHDDADMPAMPSAQQQQQQPAAEPLNSREAIARAARISSATVGQIEKIQKTASPALVAAVKAGEVSINAAAAVASLPIEEQEAAVAGGKKQLQQAARQVREAKAGAKPAAASSSSDAEDGAPGKAPPTEMLIASLRQTIADLTAENAELKARLAALNAA